MNTSTIEFQSRDKILFLTTWAEIITSQPLFQNTFILRRPGAVNYPDIKITIILKMKILCVFPDITKIVNFWSKKC